MYVIIMIGDGMKAHRYICIVLLLLIIAIPKIHAEDIYDIVLFWGQSNMTGYAGINPSTADKVGEDALDPRVASIGISNYSNITGIREDILNNYTKMNHVNVQIPGGVAYEYKYSTNSLQEITPNTQTLGEMIAYNGSSFVSVGRQTYFALQESYGTNMVPEFAKIYHEQTGRKVIAIMASNGGEEIAHFLPYNVASQISMDDNTNKKEQHIYEALKEKYQAAVAYLNNHNMKIGNQIYVVAQGEQDAEYLQTNKDGYKKQDYIDRFTSVHNYLKELGITLGLIVETSYTYGEGTYYNGTVGIHEAQEYIINNNEDILLGSNLPYRNYVPNEANYSGGDYQTALNNSYYNICNTPVDNNAIHFNSAALSQIGYESAMNVANYYNNKVFYDNLSVDKSNKLILNINPGTTVSNIINSIYISPITIKNNSGETISSNDRLGTGNTVTIKSNQNYKVSVKGDVLGTGEANYENAKAIAKRIIDNSGLDEKIYKSAADYNNDSEVKMNDVMMILTGPKR